MTYYRMVVGKCFLCNKSHDGRVEDFTQKNLSLVDCKHLISKGVLDLQIFETQELLRELKTSRKYAKEESR